MTRPKSELATWARACADSLAENGIDAIVELSTANTQAGIRTTTGAIVSAWRSGKVSAGGPAAARNDALAVLASANLVAGYKPGATGGMLLRMPEPEPEPEPSAARQAVDEAKAALERRNAEADERLARLDRALDGIGACLQARGIAHELRDLVALALGRPMRGGGRTMMAEVARLNRSEPPPGIVIERFPGSDTWIVHRHVAAPGLAIKPPLFRQSEAEAIDAAWAHHEERNDPPGLRVSPGECDGEWRVSIVWGLSQDIDGEHDPRRHASQAAARAAAWAYYWRRVAVAEALMFGPPGKPQDRWAHEAILVEAVERYGPFWPRCLAWPDKQVAEVESWIAEGGEFPEALRG